VEKQVAGQVNHETQISNIVLIMQNKSPGRQFSRYESPIFSLSKDLIVQDY
jgi:hypothetical protein